mgnify:CR=1 FL=1|tara:strand:- start:11392 stop:11844 length:453 start_codon:yes stop_codon:yes gene_type:complete
MNEGELEELVLVRTISASSKAIFRAWTEPKLMQQWLAPDPNVITSIINNPERNGEIKIEIQSPDGTQHFINGTYQVVTPYSYIAQSWQYSGPIDVIRDIETLLEIKLTEIGASETVLTLTQSRMKTMQACDAYKADWPNCLDKLENIFLH